MEPNKKYCFTFFSSGRPKFVFPKFNNLSSLLTTQFSICMAVGSSSIEEPNQLIFSVHSFYVLKKCILVDSTQELTNYYAPYSIYIFFKFGICRQPDSDRPKIRKKVLNICRWSLGRTSGRVWVALLALYRNIFSKIELRRESITLKKFENCCYIKINVIMLDQISNF